MITAIYIITKLEDFSLIRFLILKNKPSYNYVENFMYPYDDIFIYHDPKEEICINKHHNYE